MLELLGEAASITDEAELADVIEESVIEAIRGSTGLRHDPGSSTGV